MVVSLSRILSNHTVLGERRWLEEHVKSISWVNWFCWWLLHQIINFLIPVAATECFNTTQTYLFQQIWWLKVKENNENLQWIILLKQTRVNMWFLYGISKVNHWRIQSMMQPPWMFPFWEKCSWINFPKRLELLLYTVLAFPKASMMGLQTEGSQIKLSTKKSFFAYPMSVCLSITVCRLCAAWAKACTLSWILTYMLGQWLNRFRYLKWI